MFLSQFASFDAFKFQTEFQLSKTSVTAMAQTAPLAGPSIGSKTSPQRFLHALYGAPCQLYGAPCQLACLSLSPSRHFVLQSYCLPNLLYRLRSVYSSTRIAALHSVGAVFSENSSDSTPMPRSMAIYRQRFNKLAQRYSDAASDAQSLTAGGVCPRAAPLKREENSRALAQAFAGNDEQ